MVRVALLVMLGLLAEPVRAVENWTIVNLGQTRRIAICTEAAQKSFLEYAQNFGIARMARSGSVIFAWGVGTRGRDAVLTCLDGSALLVLYAPQSALSGIEADRLSEMFERHNTELEQAYVTRALEANGY